MQLPVLYIVLVLIFPLVSGLVSFFVPIKGIHLLSPVFLAFGLIMAGMMPIFPEVTYRWIWLADMSLGIRIDGLSAILIIVVYIISLLVHIFSIHYMKGDAGINRYYFKLGFFTTSMIGLLLADHLILLFVFWELVGFSSYLLIGFWFRDTTKANSARTAFMINRVADAGLLIGILILITVYDVSFLSELNALGASSLLTFVGIMLAIGAFGKSAQFPFFGWLNKAMAGPTPVSALIHAATMVTAGVYLLVRVEPILTSEVLMLIALIGAITAFIAGISALFQNDIKAVLAYSTVSQLGYMIMGVGVGAVQASVFHLWSHAFFKAGLFLAAGSVIHFMHQANHAVDSQDMRNMGGLRNALPYTFITFLVCGAALAGLPLTSGFLSKEGILIASLSWYSGFETGDNTFALVVNIFAFGAAICTPLYVVRQILVVFFDKPRTAFSSKISRENMEPLVSVKFPLVLLILGSLWLVSSFNPLDTDGWFFSKMIFGRIGVQVLAPWIGTLAFSASILFLLFGLVVGYSFFKPGSKKVLLYKESETSENPIIQMLYTGWHIDKLYFAVNSGSVIVSSFVAWFDAQVVDRVVNVAGISFVVLGKLTGGFDRYIVDGLVNMIARCFKSLGRITTRTQAPNIQAQLSFLLLILLGLMYWLLFR